MGTNFFDQYSLLHFAFGVIAFFFNIGINEWIIIHAIFEIAENTNTGMYVANTYFKDIWPGGKPYADSVINSIGDSIFAVLGWGCAYYLNEYGNKYLYKTKA